MSTEPKTESKVAKSALKKASDKKDQSEAQNKVAVPEVNPVAEPGVEVKLD